MQDFKKPEGSGQLAQNIRSIGDSIDRQSQRTSYGIMTSSTSRGTFRTNGTKRPVARNSPNPREIVARWA